MNKEKQKIISDICPFYKEYGTCEQCNTSLDIGDGPCYFECMANAIINNNYVKQSEGEWVVTDADSGSFGEYEPFIEFKCPKCESAYGIESGQYGWQYGEPIPWVACPLCGAKMKGGAEK